jgi:hypothetical protein
MVASTSSGRIERRPRRLRAGLECEQRRTEQRQYAVVVDERAGVDELLREHRRVPPGVIRRVGIRRLIAHGLAPSQHHVMAVGGLRESGLDNDVRAERRCRQDDARCELSGRRHRHARGGETRNLLELRDRRAAIELAAGGAKLQQLPG